MHFALLALSVVIGWRTCAPNIPEMLVANFGVPLAGAVIVPINVRLSAEEVRYICDHSGAKLLIADTEYLPALAPVLGSLQTVQQVVALSDPLGPASPAAVEHAHISYDELMARGSGDPLPWTVDDELGLNIVISGGENISTIETSTRSSRIRRCSRSP